MQLKHQLPQSVIDIYHLFCLFGSQFHFYQLKKNHCVSCPFEVRGLVTFTLRCVLIMTFYHKHNGLHDTHFDRGAKKRDSMRSLANLSRPGRVVTNIF